MTNTATATPTVESPRLTSRDFVIHVPSPSLACLLDDCTNCPTDTDCTHDCHKPA